MGRTMHELLRVHDLMPRVPAVGLETDGGAPAVAAMRFDQHLDHCGQTPRLVAAAKAPAGVRVKVGADGSVRVVTR